MLRFDLEGLTFKGGSQTETMPPSMNLNNGHGETWIVKRK